MQRFGPINGLAGKRRLNVLFTRAKQKIVTFSSMTAADIVAEEHGNPGAYMLKRWLEYSASGVLDGGVRTEREPDSDFELFVIKQVQAMGCEAVAQVGVAGYFVDIGVRHPEWPHGFVLGVECDGASYHSAKSARDRDRLRQEVLERLGWSLHRIWSTDWFNNPQREGQRLREVIAARLSELKTREFEYAPPRAAEASQKSREAVVLSLFREERSATHPAAPAQPQAPTGQTGGIAIGDTVRVRYLTDDRKTMRITISSSKSDPSQGIINCDTPVARALLGAEEGDEVEVLVGSYVKPAIVESIIKGTKKAVASS
jgi:transcription elongation GreA/GreB family factor/very-short-patch-repair endonuclease